MTRRTGISYEPLRREADVVLVASELVANAARSCAGELELGLVVHTDRIEISVTDDNPQPARLQHPEPLACLAVEDTLTERDFAVSRTPIGPRYFAWLNVVRDPCANEARWVGTGWYKRDQEIAFYQD